MAAAKMPIKKVAPKALSTRSSAKRRALAPDLARKVAAAAEAGSSPPFRSFGKLERTSFAR